MITKTDTLLTKALTDKKIISQETLRLLADEAAKSKDTLFHLLLKKGLVSEDDLLKIASDLLRLPVVDLTNFKAEQLVLDKVPLKIAEYYKMAPMKLDKRKLTIAVSAPLDLRTQDDIRAHLGFEIDMVLAREQGISEYLKKMYGFAAGTIGEMIAQAPPKAAAQHAFEKSETIENIEKLAGDASIASLVNQIILEAYRKRATDIHIEPYRGKVKLRYRIDGILYDANVPAEINRFIMAILSRIKIMSSLNIVEKRLPQDGRAIVKVEDTQLDLRVSSIPTPYGESVVIRMLPMNRVFDMSQLGLSAKQLQMFETLIAKPHGILFITGPTGSGKSTTLYACLNKINTDDRKIITIEDPVEYEMEGVTQIQVVSSIGLDFARGLRSMLRHDPDVMMVGEVRDLETAEMAIRVALTGHLVFSTLHTNDAASGITRLVDIGIPPYLVASSVEAFIAQRLVRTLCPACKEEDKAFAPPLKQQIAKDIGISPDKVPVYHGKGCNNCNFTGFWGRQAIYEILFITENIKRLIMQKASSSDIKAEALAHGMRTLRQDGWQKVIAGLTTPGEIFEATPSDEEARAARPEKEEKTSFANVPEKVAFSPAIKMQDVLSPAFKEPKPNDRRIFVRLDTSVTVCYRPLKNDEVSGVLSDKKIPEECTVTKDISAGGLSLFLQEAVPVGTILEMRIELPNTKEPIECLARVVRQQVMEGTIFNETAVCFLDLSGRDRQSLEKFVEKEKK